MAMAAPLLMPLLEAAGTAIASGWAAFVGSGAATAAVGGTATAVILSIPGDTAQDKDKAQADAGATTRTRARECKCPPDRGELVVRNRVMSSSAREYQAYVTGFAAGTEWNFSGIDFDGYRSALCQLEEAKANYDQFFENGMPRYWWRDSGAADMIEEAGRQNSVAMQNPNTRLRWYFMQPICCNWATSEFIGRGYMIVTEWKSM